MNKEKEEIERRMTVERIHERNGKGRLNLEVNSC
jgi:hypothetical protein